MNGLRIGGIGVTVEYWGQEMAEGFLHDFEGWAMFMASFSVLLAEVWVLGWIGRDTTAAGDARPGVPAPTPAGARIERRSVPRRCSCRQRCSPRVRRVPRLPQRRM